MFIPAIVSFLGVVALFRMVRNFLTDPLVRAIFIAVAIQLAVGTVVYRHLEGWSVLNSLYFCVVTLLTIGFGDYVPTTGGGKIFTIIYCFLGVGLIAAAASTIVQRSRVWARIEEAGQKGEAQGQGANEAD